MHYFSGIWLTLFKRDYSQPHNISDFCSGCVDACMIIGMPDLPRNPDQDKVVVNHENEKLHTQVHPVDPEESLIS